MCWEIRHIVLCCRVMGEREVSEKEKMTLLEEVLETDAGALSPTMRLDGIPGYDSMTKLSLMVMAEDEFGVKLTGERINSFITVGDILNALQ